MAPIRPEDHTFVFRAAVMTELRRELGLNQAELAELLDVPVNTLSRWERGSNVPDANALAALFSVAKERGVDPAFFTERKGAIMDRHSRKDLVVQWDFQNMAFDADGINAFIPEIRDYMQLIFPRLEGFKATAYGSGVSWAVSNALSEVEVVTRTSYFNADRQLIQDGELIFGLPQSTNVHLDLFPTSGNLQKIDPRQAVYILISNDGGYVEFLEQLKKVNVETFVCGNRNRSDRLIKAVGLDHFIPWQRPYVVTKCVEVAQELPGETISKSSFGNKCRVALEEDEFDKDDYTGLLEDAGFSLNRPFASVLQHVRTMGILRAKQSTDDADRVTL